jgi:hypothetical protein
MSMSSENKTDPNHARFAGLPAKLMIELIIGLGLAGVLILVAWASSNAIRFVYGGY